MTKNFLEPYDAAVRAIDEQFDKLGRAIGDNPQQVESFRNYAISNVSASRCCAKISSAVGGDELGA